jgi:heme-degrading monooxygenase HmoA
MYSRVTQLEIDTVRFGLDEAVALFREQVLPAMHEQDGYAGATVLTTPDGKALLITVWEDEEAAIAAAGFAAEQLARYATLFASPPGREYYEVAYADMPGVLVG